MAQQLGVTLITPDTLELTFTQAVVSCYQAAQGVLNDVALVAAEPTTLEDVILSDDGNLSPGGEALYWLQNLTDMPLQFWSRGPGQSKKTVPFAFEPSDLGELQSLASCCHLAACCLETCLQSLQASAMPTQAVPFSIDSAMQKQEHRNCLCPLISR